MATLVTSGRAGLAASVKARDIYLGIGSGQTSWDSSLPAETTASTDLETAIGYRKSTQKDFVTVDANGSITLPSGNYTVSSSETNLLYIKFQLQFEDANTSTIRETGIFLDATVDASLPSGQMFFTASEVTDTGTLYLIEHIASVIRTPATRESFEFVLTF